MTAPAAIQGSLVGIRNVSTHKSACLTIHIPEEQAQSFIDAFGWPTMANPVPVALARMAPSELKQQLQESVEIERKKEPRDWNTLLPSNQAALKCNEPMFWQFLNEQVLNHKGVGNSQDAATLVRRMCNVNSRADFDHNDGKRAAWEQIYSDYQTWERATR